MASEEYKASEEPVGGKKYPGDKKGTSNTGTTKVYRVTNKNNWPIDIAIGNDFFKRVEPSTLPGCAIELTENQVNSGDFQAVKNYFSVEVK